MGKGTLPPIPMGYQPYQPDEEIPPLPSGYSAEPIKKKVGGEDLSNGGTNGSFAGLLGGSVKGANIGSAAIKKLPIEDISEYNKRFEDITGHKELNLGSDLPQIAKAREEKKYLTYRDIEEKQIKPVLNDVASGVVQSEDLKKLYQQPYGKKIVSEVINQNLPEIGTMGLDEDVFGNEKKWEAIAQSIQSKNRQQGVDAQNQQEFELDNELANSLKDYTYGQDHIAVRGGGEAVNERQQKAFGIVNTTSPSELSAALRNINNSSKVWDSEGNEVDKKLLAKKIGTRLFQIKAQEDIHPEITQLSDKVKSAISKVPVEWKKQGMTDELLNRDAEYVIDGLNYIRDSDPGRYAMIMGTIYKLDKIAETDYQELVGLGKEINSFKKFKQGEYVEKDNRNFLTPQGKKALLGGWLYEELKRTGKNKQTFRIPQKDILEAYKNVPAELKDDDLLRDIIKDEVGPAFGFLPIAKGEGIPKRGLGRQILTNTADPFAGILKTADYSFDSPFDAYLKSKELDRGDNIVLNSKGEYTNKSSDTFFNKAVGGLFSFLSQVGIARGIGAVTAKGTNALIGQVAPRAATVTTSEAALNVGTPLSVIAQQYGDEYVDFLEKTGNPTKAALGAFVSTVTQGAIERFVLPDVKIADQAALLFARKNLAKDIINVVENGGGKVGVLKTIKDFTANTLSTLSKEAIAEENLQNFANYLTEMVVSPKTAQNRDLMQETEDITKAAVVQMAIPAVLGGAGETKIKRGLNKVQLNHIGVNAEDYQKALDNQFAMGKMLQEDYDLASGIIQLHRDNIINAPKYDSKGELISAERQLEYAYQSTVQETLQKQAEKQKDKIQREPIEKKIEEADKIKRQIFYGEEAEGLPPKEGQPITIDQDRDLMDEEGQDLSKDELLATLKSKAGELEQGMDLQYFKDKAAEDPAKYIGKYGEETVMKLIESVPTETLQGNLDLFIEMNPDNPSVKILDNIIAKREQSKNPPIDQVRELADENTPDEAGVSGSALKDVVRQELNAEKLNKEAGVDIYVATQDIDANGVKYTLSQIKENGNTNTFLIEDAKGNEVGKAQLSANGNYLENIRIDEKHRRKGLASKVYDFIELRKGIELEPSPNKQSKEAKALWGKRNLQKSVSNKANGGLLAKALGEAMSKTFADFRNKQQVLLELENKYFEQKRISKEEFNKLSENEKSEIIKDAIKWKNDNPELVKAVEDALTPTQYTEAATHRQNIHDKFRKEFEGKGVPKEQVDGAIALLEARAKSWASEEKGRNADDWYSRIADVKSGEFVDGSGKQFQVEAYHGSPHDFDKFSISKIGTGEGAAAFGHGLYFTDLKGIAEEYARRLSNDSPTIDGKKIDDWFRDNDLKAPYISNYWMPELLSESKSKEEALSKIDLRIKSQEGKIDGYNDILDDGESTQNERAGARRALEVLEKDLQVSYDLYNAVFRSKSFEPPTKGRNLYKVSLHEGKQPSEYNWLDWDKDLPKEKIDKIRKALLEYDLPDGYSWATDSNKNKNHVVHQVKDAKGNIVGEGIDKEEASKDAGVGKRFYPYFGEERRLAEFDKVFKRGSDGKYTTGAGFYHRLSELLGSDKAASDLLLKAGIDGVKYPAESIARGATSDNARGFNYVVFDDKVVTIKEKIQFQNQQQGKPKGAVETLADGRKVIHALDAPDFSTMVHEIAHVFEGDLTKAEQKIVKDFGGSEPFARGFEKYLRDGKAPTTELKTLFEKFKQWLTNIYKTLKGSPIEKRISPEIKQIFDRLLTEKGEPKAPTQYTEAATPAKKESGGVSGSALKDVGDIKLKNGNKLVINKDRSVKAGKNFAFDENSYDVQDKDGNNIGSVHISDRGDYYQISNIKLKNERTGLGTEIYKTIIQKLDKPLISDKALSEKAKGLWNKLVNEGVAEKFKDTFELGGKTYTEDRYRTKAPAPYTEAATPKEQIQENNLNLQDNGKEASNIGGKENQGTSNSTQPPIEDSEGAGKEPPPKKPPVAEKEKGDGRNKGVLSHLAKAKNIPEEARKGFEEEGLKYETKSQTEAAQVAKSIIDELGIDEAVSAAEAMKFDGDVNSLIFAEALNQLAEQETKATTPEAKLEAAMKFAEVGITYDKMARYGGRFNAAINYFYKKSPLGVVMMENARRKDDFNQWSKPKDKSWKEFYEELMKEPEFADIVNTKVQEELKKERAAAREKRKDKVQAVFKKAKDQFRGGAAYSTIIPPKVIIAAIDLMEQAYLAGEAVAKVIQDGIDYISTELGTTAWDSDKFRKEWEAELRESVGKKTLTDAELKTKLLDKFRNKLKGLTDEQKEDVIRKSYKKIIESGGLEFDDFKEIIAQATGRADLTAEEAAKMKELVQKTNAVDDAAQKWRTEKTKEAEVGYRKAQIEATKATRDLNDMFQDKPDIIRRLVSMMQLNTLGVVSLVANVAYNVWNQSFIRFPIGVINNLFDRGISLFDKNYTREFATIEAQKDFWQSLGVGSKEAVQQIGTGLSRQDYLSKEVPSQFRPFKSVRDLWAWKNNKKNLTKAQFWDKVLQAMPQGMSAEIVARLLNVGDKPQRFGAEGAQAATFAKALGLKDIDKQLFIEFPREQAYEAYKAQGYSDEVAGQKADYIKEAIIKEGKRSTFQQDNLLNDAITRAAGVLGGKDSGTAGLAKSLVLSPYIKIPTNAFWSMYNMVNPEVAILQAITHAGIAKKFKNKGELTKASLQNREARYWMAHAIWGMAMRAIVISLVKSGAFVPAADDDESKKERDANSFFDRPGYVNVGNLKISNRWFGVLGAMGNVIAKKWKDMTPEQRDAQDDFWNTVFGGMEIDTLKEMENGVFANSSSLLQSLNTGDWSRYGINTINLFANIVQPATSAQFDRAQLDYVPTSKGDNFLDRLNQNFAQRSKLYRRIFDVQINQKKDIWGKPVPKGGNELSRMFGISKNNPQLFGRVVYDDFLRSGDSGFLPPAVLPILNGQQLNAEQENKLIEYVGSEREKLVKPYINDMAEIDGFNAKYSQLETDEDKKFVLQYLYNEGRDRGVELFYQDYPELRPKEEQADYKKEAQKDIFKTLQKYKK